MESLALYTLLTERKHYFKGSQRTQYFSTLISTLPQMLTLRMFLLLSYSVHQVLPTLQCAPDRAPPAQNVSGLPSPASLFSPSCYWNSHILCRFCFVLFMIKSNTLKSFYLLKYLSQSFVLISYLTNTHWIIG